MKKNLKGSDWDSPVKGNEWHGSPLKRGGSWSG